MDKLHSTLLYCVVCTRNVRMFFEINFFSLLYAQVSAKTDWFYIGLVTHGTNITMNEIHSCCAYFYCFINMVLAFINLRIFSAKYKVMCTTVCSYTQGLISIFSRNAINVLANYQVPLSEKHHHSILSLLFLSILQIVLQSIFPPSFAAFSPFSLFIFCQPDN